MKTGINFARCNCGSAQAHNERKAEYLEALERSGKKTYDIFHDRTATNLHWTNPAYAGKSLEQILQDCRERYTASIGQAPQEQDRVRKVKDKKTGLYKEVTTAGWSPIREGVCPVKENTQLSDFNPLIKHLAAKGVRVISIDIHRDEGHTDPLTGERKYNYHAHVIADWTDHITGKTAKLNNADMSEVQTVLADALGMERGESKEVTGKDHLTPAQQREQAAAKRAGQLEAKADRLQVETDRAQRSMEEAQQREAEAVERAEEAEKAASREQLRSNLADAGARVARLFGRGALAEAKADREARDAAEKEAAEARQAAEKAQKAQKQAEIARSAAETAERTARQEKSAYGREMYENGVADGIKQGRASAQASIAPLQEQLAAKQEQLDQANQRAEAAENEVKSMKGWNPSMQNWQQSVKDMRAAGMSPQQIQQVFRRGFLEGVQVPVYEHRGTTYSEEAKVSLNPSKTTGSMQAWFNGARLASFIEQAVQKVKNALGLNRGMHM